MALTEARFRLLRRDPDSPSGYKIVGEMTYCSVQWAGKNLTLHPDVRLGKLWRAGMAEFWRRRDASVWCALPMTPPKCDALEPGVCIDGTWYYEGDLVQHGNMPHVYELAYDETLSSWYMHSLLDGEDYYIHDPHILTPTGTTIHDKPADAGEE